jgi:hypothetical protein
MTSNMKRRWLVGLVGAWAFAACLYAVFFREPSARQVSLRDLIKTEGSSTAGWDGKLLTLEGYWRGNIEGVSVSTSVGRTLAVGDFLLMRPDPSFIDNGFSLESILPDQLRRGMFRVFTGDYVRITGIYHANGYQPPGFILDDCEWFQFQNVERWDRPTGKWQRVEAMGW